MTDIPTSIDTAGQTTERLPEKICSGDLDPWDMGEQAHARGAKLNDNPFPNRTFQHCRWMCGWVSADNPSQNT